MFYLYSITECDCPDPKKHTGNCALGTGLCECTEAYRGAEDCSKCADGEEDTAFYDITSMNI